MLHFIANANSPSNITLKVPFQSSPFPFMAFSLQPKTIPARMFLSCSRVTVPFLFPATATNWHSSSPSSRPFGTQPKKLLKRNWQEGLVYLFQFPRSPVLPNLSPFCLKVETFLRANQLKYQAIGSWRARSAEGRLPFIELNGKQVADSQVILWHLIEQFGIDDGLDAEQRARGRAIERMVEGSTYHCILRFVSYENARGLVHPRVSGLPIPAFISLLLAAQLEKAAEKRLIAEGTIRQPREVSLEILRRDLTALRHLLGDKKFFLGIRPSLADFAFFGHLGVAFHLPFEHPVKQMLEEEEFRTLRQLIDRIRLHYWHEDWPGRKEEEKEE